MYYWIGLAVVSMVLWSLWSNARDDFVRIELDRANRRDENGLVQFDNLALRQQSDKERWWKGLWKALFQFAAIFCSGATIFAFGYWWNGYL